MIYPQKFDIPSGQKAAYDVLTEAHICSSLKDNFGKRIFFGSALGKNVPYKEKQVIECCEMMFRGYLKDITNAVEIGTKYGLSALLIAHYAYHLTTIDIIPRTEPMRIWDLYGLSPKITYAVVDDNKEKAEYVKGLDFDFAFIDGDHSYEGIKLDFKLVRKCGRVLFHDYDYSEPPLKDDVNRFIEELPKEEVKINEPFAYWEKK